MGKFEERVEKAKKLADKHVLWNQSMVVEDMLKAGLLDLEEDSNYLEVLSKEGEEYEDAILEIFEWYLVTPWLANRLKEKGEVVLDSGSMDFWWGRTTTGQSVIVDEVIQEIAEENL